MSDSNNQPGDFPVVTKEKVMRVLTHLVGPAIIGVTAINFFMPSVNKALGLLVNGVWSLTELGIAAICATAIITAALAFWPVYKRGVESLARKATWAIFEWDPITPMVLWIDEIERDGQSLETALANVDGVVSKNEERIVAALDESTVAQQRFNVAVKKFGADSHQAQMASIDVGTPKQTAETIAKMNEPLKVLRDCLTEVAQASEFTLGQAKAQVKQAQIQWEAALETEKANDAGFRIMRGRSERSKNADLAMGMIRDRYASQFGRMRTLRKLSEGLLNRVNLEQGVFHEGALLEFKKQTALLTGKPVVGDVIDISATVVREPVRIGGLYDKK
jgi:hypothetical protein